MSLWRLTRRQERAALNRCFGRWGAKIKCEFPGVSCHPKQFDADGWSDSSTTSDPSRSGGSLDQAQCHSSFAGTLRFKDEAVCETILMRPNPAPDKNQIGE